MASGRSIENGIDDIPGAGLVAWVVGVQRNAHGDVSSRWIKTLRDAEANRPFGSEDPRYRIVAAFLRAAE